MEFRDSPVGDVFPGDHSLYQHEQPADKGGGGERYSHSYTMTVRKVIKQHRSEYGLDCVQVQTLYEFTGGVEIDGHLLNQIL